MERDFFVELHLFLISALRLLFFWAETMRRHVLSLGFLVAVAAAAAGAAHVWEEKTKKSLKSLLVFALTLEPNF